MSDGQMLNLLSRLASQPVHITELVETASRLESAGEHQQATLLYQLWIKCNPEEPLLFVACFNLGTSLSKRGDLAGAQAAFERAIERNPDFFPAYINLAGVLERQGLIDPALQQWNAVVTRLGNVSLPSLNHKSAALKQMGRVFEANHRPEAAEAALRQSLNLNPDQVDVVQHLLSLRMVQCEWPIVSPWDELTSAKLMKGFNPLTLAAYSDDPLYQLATAWQYNLELGDPPAGSEYLWKTVPRQKSSRLKIGYVSSDLRDHAVGYLMSELLEIHDRDKVEIFAYYCGIPPEDRTKARIRAAVEHWVDITGMDDLSAAQRVAADGIDILVDVNGYTRDARTKMFAYRPVPIQVNWLGFPGTMGSPYHHYIIADEWIIPEAFEQFYSEKVVRLPCYQPNDRKRVVAEPPTREQAGLPEDAFVFCCFNGTQKVTRFTFDRWMRILHAVPDSVLWLLSSTPETEQRLRDNAAAAGIAVERLIFAPKMANAHHLARYPLADLFLDTAPYGAHTTASDALWMSVPVLTLSARGFASRVCGSLVRSAGVPELVVEDPEAYVETAIRLAGDRATLDSYRQRLAANRDSCVLFDMDLLARSLEQLFQRMVDDFQAGRLPEPDLTNLRTYLDLAVDVDHEATEMLAVKDYEGFYRAKLEAVHKFRRIPEDRRLWTAEHIRAADAK